MENTCSQYLILVLLSLSTSPPPPAEASADRLRSVRMHETALTWNQARSYCRSANGDLAIQRYARDVSDFGKICGELRWTCWVGLHDSAVGWRWNNGPNVSLLDANWSAGKPQGANCGTVSRGRLSDNRCAQELFFLCENNHLVLVTEEKTWEEALDHCRALGPDAWDLLSFHNDEEVSHAQDVMAQTQTEEAWVGLRWLAGRWLWLDRTVGGVVSLAECPADGNHCGALSGGGQRARNCVEKRRFLCLK